MTSPSSNARAGTTHAQVHPSATCASCYGRGWNHAGIVRTDESGRPYGTGVVERAPCRWCNGTGRR